MNTKKDAKTCTLCEEPLNNNLINGTYTMSSCKHEFHTDCVFFWYKENKHCPSCVLPMDNLRVTYNDRQSKITYLKKYSRKTTAPKNLKKITNAIKQAKEAYKKAREERKEFKIKHGDIIKMWRKMNTNYYATRRAIRVKESLLANYPTIILPNKLVIRVPYEN
jgi:hypothetical protein